MSTQVVKENCQNLVVIVSLSHPNITLCD